LAMQELDRAFAVPEGATFFQEVRKIPAPLLRSIRTRFSPSLINLSEVASSTVLREIIGTWDIRTATPSLTASFTPSFTVSAFGRPVKGATVTLFSNDRVVARGETDEKGRVTFRMSYADPGVYDYYAVVGEKKPFIISGNPRVSSFRVAVWLVCTHSRNLTDVWARWQGRSFFRPLPIGFWNEMPSSVVGLAGRNVGYVDLVPCSTEP